MDYHEDEEDDDEVDEEQRSSAGRSVEGASPSFSFSSHGSQLSGSGISVIAAALASDSQVGVVIK